MQQTGESVLFRSAECSVPPAIELALRTTVGARDPINTVVGVDAWAGYLGSRLLTTYGDSMCVGQVRKMVPIQAILWPHASSLEPDGQPARSTTFYAGHE